MHRSVTLIPVFGGIESHTETVMAKRDRACGVNPAPATPHHRPTVTIGGGFFSYAPITVWF